MEKKNDTTPAPSDVANIIETPSIMPTPLSELANRFSKVSRDLNFEWEADGYDYFVTVEGERVAKFYRQKGTAAPKYEWVYEGENPKILKLKPLV